MLCLLVDGFNGNWIRRYNMMLRISDHFSHDQIHQFQLHKSTSETSSRIRERDQCIVYSKEDPGQGRREMKNWPWSAFRIEPICQWLVMRRIVTGGTGVGPCNRQIYRTQVVGWNGISARKESNERFFFAIRTYHAEYVVDRIRPTRSRRSWSHHRTYDCCKLRKHVFRWIPGTFLFTD